jgi:hypothetical protein
VTDTDGARLAASLRAAGDDDAGSVLATIDRSDPAAARSVLAAMEAIAEELVVPASALLTSRDDGWTYFDLDQLAGYEYPGLISGVLATDFPTLQAPPPDGELADRLGAAGFDIDDPAHRRGFFLGWMATRASALLETLADFLARGGLTFDDDALDALERLIRMPLRGATRWSLAELLAAVSPERARAFLETIGPGHLRQALEDALQA